MNAVLNFYHTYSSGLLVRGASMTEVFLCIFFYTLPFHKKKHFSLRLCAGTTGALALLLPLSVLYVRYPGKAASAIFTQFLLYAYFLAVLLLLYQESITELLLCLCAGIATQMITGRLFEYLYMICGKNPYRSLSFFQENTLPSWLDWLLYYGLHLLLILLISRLFARKKVYTHDRSLTWVIVLFSLSITLVTIPLTTWLRPLESQNASLAQGIRIFSILYAFLVLILRTGILEQSRIREELRITDELLYAEKKQFENVREDMEMINIKCHDIRHQLTRYAGKLTNKELEALKEAIRIYDATIKTGNDILDMILYKKQPVCEQNQIHISCIADGGCLSFLAPSHLYSLFNNALENAIDAVLCLDDPQMRIISLNIARENGLIAIHMTNYYKGGCLIENGLPLTDKPDKGHHGFGVKSLRYIALQYQGTISFETDDPVFYLHIHFPEP